MMIKSHIQVQQDNIELVSNKVVTGKVLLFFDAFERSNLFRLDITHVAKDQFFVHIYSSPRNWPIPGAQILGNSSAFSEIEQIATDP